MFYIGLLFSLLALCSSVSAAALKHKLTVTQATVNSFVKTVPHPEPKDGNWWPTHINTGVNGNEDQYMAPLAGIFHAVMWYNNNPVYMWFDGDGNVQAVIFCAPDGYNNPWGGDPIPGNSWFLTPYDCNGQGCFDDHLNGQTQTITFYAISVGSGVSAVTNGFYNDNHPLDSAGTGTWIQSTADLRPDFISVDFDTDNAAIAMVQPLTIKQQTVDNTQNDQPEGSSVSVTKETSSTTSWSQTISFSYTVGVSVCAGFDFIGEGSVTFSTSFTLGESDTFSTGTESSSSETYTFPLNAGPHEMVEGKAIVQEGHLNVPYHLVFRVYDDYQVQVAGTWTGVTYGSATFQIICMQGCSTAQEGIVKTINNAHRHLVGAC